MTGIASIQHDWLIFQKNKGNTINFPNVNLVMNIKQYLNQSQVPNIKF